jgi:hypothetical protein
MSQLVGELLTSCAGEGPDEMPRLAGLLFACCWLALSAQQTRLNELPVIDGRQLRFAHGPR